MVDLKLSGLYIYPIKSAAGIEVETAQLTTRGFKHDRRWMVVDSGGKFMSQRKHPRMVLIEVSLEETLKISASDMPDLLVPLVPETGERVDVEVWGDRCEAIACGSETQQWFTQFMGTDCQLVYMPDSSDRPTAHGKLGADNLVSFADAYPYLLISEASLNFLNDKLVARGKTTVSIERFRPNMVVRGVEKPHEEDRWQQVQIGDAVFELPKLCDRCSIPTVHPKTGDRGKEPNETLATYRYWDRGIWFGQNAVQQQGDYTGQVLSLGDSVQVLQTKDKGATAIPSAASL